MNIFLIYLLKVNIALSIVFALYLLLFRNNTLFQSKRIFLWSICAFTLIYPFISIPTANPEPFLQDINYYFIADDFYFDDANAVNVRKEAINTSINLSQIIFLLYLTVTVAFSIRFITQYIGLIKLIRRGKSIQLLGHKVTVLSQKTAPFSFFSRIVIDQETSQGSGIQEILTHEQTHVDQKHSIDVIFSEIYTIFCWFNPLTWLLRKEIRLNLEYLADASVIRSGYDAEKYQFHILRLSYPLAIAKLHTGFNFSPLKKRIKMMNTKKSPAKAYIKYILFIPVVAALLLLNQKKMDAMPSIPEALVAPIENLMAEATVQAPAKTKQEPAKKQESAKKQEPVKKTQHTPVTNVTPGKDGVYDYVEQMPQYPGGDTEFLKFVQSNLKYPIEAQAKGISGVVRVRFVVEKDGSIGEVKIDRSLTPECDEASAEAIKKSPKWIPGKQKDQVVAVWYSIPVRFELAGGDKKTNSQDPNFSGFSDDIIIVEMDETSDVNDYRVVSIEGSKESGSYKIERVVADRSSSSKTVTIPEFPGGNRALLRAISHNLAYPVKAQEKNVQGIVRVQIIIKKDGSIGDINVIQQLEAECNKAALDAVSKVVKNGQKWTSGKNNGQDIDTQFIVPIKFHLVGGDNNATEKSDFNGITVVGYGPKK